MDQLGIQIVGGYFRNCADLRTVHDNAVALRMALAAVVAVDLGEKELGGIVSGHGAGDDVGAGILPVQIHLKGGLGSLGSMRHELFVR